MPKHAYYLNNKLSRFSTIRVEGPILVTDDSVPFGSAMTEDSPDEYALMRKYHYVEEEFFISGRADVFGPDQKLSMRTGEYNDWDMRPLSRALRTRVGYKTRMVVLRPKDLSSFSGVVHIVPVFSQISAGVSTPEENLLRNGDGWIGVEVCSGTRYGPNEIPSGGIAFLKREFPERYPDLKLIGPASDWPDLGRGNLGRAYKSRNFNFTVDSYAARVTRQELFRSQAQGPDILSQVAHLLKLDLPGNPFGGHAVRRLYTSGGSANSLIMRVYIDYHHDRAALPDGRPPFDGYLVSVGMIPSVRPKDAVLVVVRSEAEAIDDSRPLDFSPTDPLFRPAASASGITANTPLPENTDQPRFRYYEVAGAGHRLVGRTTSNRKLKVGVPAGIVGLSDRGATPRGRELYDKNNTPILWGMWRNMYRWVNDGAPMPTAPPISRDATAPDGIARDRFGNALGGLRTPWVDVPDARYVARMSREDFNNSGIERFSDEQMIALYGNRANYIRKLDERIDQMVRDRWIDPGDAELMRLK
jgi:hypothetical protein